MKPSVRDSVRPRGWTAVRRKPFTGTPGKTSLCIDGATADLIRKHGILPQPIVDGHDHLGDGVGEALGYGARSPAVHASPSRVPCRRLGRFGMATVVWHQGGPPACGSVSALEKPAEVIVAMGGGAGARLPRRSVKAGNSEGPKDQLRSGGATEWRSGRGVESMVRDNCGSHPREHWPNGAVQPQGEARAMPRYIDLRSF
jgi:hypothetical protein